MFYDMFVNEYYQSPFGGGRVPTIIHWIKELKTAIDNISINNSFNLGDQIDNSTGTNFWDVLKELVSKLGDVAKAVANLVGDLVSGLLDLLKSLFIPSDDYFEGFTNDLKSEVTSRTSLLNDVYSIYDEYLARLGGTSAAAYNESVYTGHSISLPGVSINLPAIGSVEVFPETNYDFDSLINGSLVDLYNIYLIIIYGLISLWTLNNVIKALNDIFHLDLTFFDDDVEIVADKKEVRA